MAVPREVLALLPRVPVELLGSVARCASLGLTQRRLAAPTAAAADARGPRDEAESVAALAEVGGMGERAAAGVFAAVSALVAAAARANAGPAALR